MTTSPGQVDRTGKARAIHATLTRALGSDPDVAIDLLPEAQLLVSKHLVPASGPETSKRPQRVPGEDGYTIYIRISAGDEGARPQQRRSQPSDAASSDPATTALRLDRTALEQSWQLRDSAASLIMLTVRCGSANVFDEVDGVLDTLRPILAAMPGGDRS